MLPSMETRASMRESRAAANRLEAPPQLQLTTATSDKSVSGSVLAYVMRTSPILPPVPASGSTAPTSCPSRRLKPHLRLEDVPGDLRAQLGQGGEPGFRAQFVHERHLHLLPVEL